MPARKRAGSAPKPAPKPEPESTAPPPAAPAAAPAPPRPRGRARSQGLVVKAPETAVKQAQREPPTKARPEPPFFYAYHPARLCVRAGKVVPHFIRISAEPGVGGVGLIITKKGRRIPVVEQAKAIARERGEQVLEWDVDGPGTSYIAQDPRSGGWFDRFTSVYSGTDKVDHNEEAFVEWVESLYARDVVERPQIWAMNALLSQLEGMEHQFKEGHPDRKRLQDQIEVVRAEIAAAYAEDKAAAERDAAAAMEAGAQQLEPTAPDMAPPAEED